jgi:hypothetical protein
MWVSICWQRSMIVRRLPPRRKPRAFASPVTTPGRTSSAAFSSSGSNRTSALAEQRSSTSIPSPEAALARPTAHDPRVAERFELYACGVEIANAFGELTDPAEQRRRFESEMAEKQRVHGERYPLDEDFLAALGRCRPASGIALGFDRLVMLATGAHAHRAGAVDAGGGIIQSWPDLFRPSTTDLDLQKTRMPGTRPGMTKLLRLPSELVAAGLAPPEKLADLKRVAERYAVAVTPEIAALIDRGDRGDPIARQFVPHIAELTTTADERADPIGDDAHSPLQGIVHRYPDRVLLKLVNVCAVYCRFCFRREMVGPGKQMLPPEKLDAALDYIAAHPEIWEVILTGGDPLVLSARRLGEVIRRIAAIDHVKIVRLHTRLPVSSPGKITPSSCAR